MWPDLPKPAYFTPSDRTHFSPPLNCYTNELIIHVYIIADDSLVYFSWGAFLRPVWHAQVLGDLQMAVVWLDKYPSSWKYPHNWPVNLAIELATICDIYSSDGSQMRPSGQFSYISALGRDNCRLVNSGESHVHTSLPSRDTYIQMNISYWYF